MQRTNDFSKRHHRFVFVSIFCTKDSWLNEQHARLCQENKSFVIALRRCWVQLYHTYDNQTFRRAPCALSQQHRSGAECLHSASFARTRNGIEPWQNLEISVSYHRSMQTTIRLFELTHPTRSCYQTKQYFITAHQIYTKNHCVFLDDRFSE